MGIETNERTRRIVGIKKALQLPEAVLKMIVTDTVDIDIAAQIVAAPLPRQNTEDYGISQDTNFERQENCPMLSLWSART